MAFPNTQQASAALALVLATSWVFATAPAGETGPRTTGATHADPAAACATLVGLRIDAARIGLPTGGASVTTAVAVAGTASATAPAPASAAPAASRPGRHAAAVDHCRVDFAIVAVDPKAPPIEATLALPAKWNGKVLMLGGGGYNGTIPDVARSVPAAPPGALTPLARGYATFASNSGHRGGGAHPDLDGSFAANDEALRNYAGDALKKTSDVARVLVGQHFGRPPTRAYVAGGSTGGREALAAIQRWPTEWDGAIALYPAWNAVSLNLQFGRIARALSLPGAYLGPAKRRLLFEAALQVCDPLDGVRDGLIANVRACNANFDPDSAQVAGRRLRCPRGSDAGDHCLSDPQIAALKTMASPLTFGNAPGGGEAQYPGFNVWGADLGRGAATPVEAGVTYLALGASAPANPMPADAPYGSVFWDQWVKHFVTRDAAAKTLELDPTEPGEWRRRIVELARLQDAGNGDLAAFHARGGKLLLAHGQADVLVSPRATARYYERLQATLGVAAVHDFVRYYEIPGYAHMASTVFDAGWDALAALEDWVERGQAPDRPVVVDTVGSPGRTRPLCPYPTWARYRGDGDVASAASFECVATLD